VSKDFIIFVFVVTKAITLQDGKAIALHHRTAILIKIHYDFHFFFLVGVSIYHVFLLLNLQE
jgi:hypothetical protein